MKKLTAISAFLASLLSPASVLAVGEDLKVNVPQINNKNVGYTNIGQFIGNVLILAFSIAILVVLIMMIWGAFEWMTSGGDKDAVGKARGRIVNALIGLAVLAVAFALANVATRFLGFPDLTTAIPIPTPP